MKFFESVSPMKLINAAKAPLPPLVLTQQGQSTNTNGSSEESLRGAKTTPQAVHKHLNLLKDKNGNILFQVRKYRGSNQPPDAVFKYDKEHQIFRRIDGGQDDANDDTPTDDTNDGGGNAA